MIQWLSEWLKQIILVVLIAAFVDLILPNHAMHRYVKTVIGLFILMTLLSPLMTIFQKHWDIDKLVANLNESNNEKTQIEPLRAIVQNAEKMNGNNEKQLQTIVETKLSEMIQQTVAKTVGQPAQSVNVSASISDMGTPSIEIVRIVLARPGNQIAQNRPAAVQDVVAPVQPVTIQIDIGEREHTKTAEDKKSDPALEEEREKVREAVQQNLELSAERIQVVFESDKVDR